MVNMLTIFSKAEIIYENGTISEGESEVGTSGNVVKLITGNYTTENNKEYKVKIKVPYVNGEIPQNFHINFGTSLEVVVINNNTITQTKDVVYNANYENNELTFILRNTKLEGTNLWYQIQLYIRGTIGEKVNVTARNPVLTIENYEITAGEQLVQNVTNAPKDVLREIITVLPVLLTIVIAYIATRKGIAFIRSILESA